MKNAIDFCHQKINQIVELFPEVKCSYEHSIEDNVHTIQVEPYEFFNSSKTLHSFITVMNKEFFSLFKGEALFVIHSKGLFPLENPSFVMSGHIYSDSNYSFSQAHFSPLSSKNSMASFIQRIERFKFNLNTQIISNNNFQVMEVKEPIMDHELAA